MRKLYFDLDGTLLTLRTGDPKPALTAGRFEAAVRRARMERLVCVGNFSRVAQLAKEIDPGYDGVGIIFDLCQGVFLDEEWFRSVTTLITDPERRAEAIDFSGDWWYLDDLAEEYLGKAGLDDKFRNEARRVFAPEPNGDGDDVVRWLAGIPEA